MPSLTGLFDLRRSWRFQRAVCTRPRDDDKLQFFPFSIARIVAGMLRSGGCRFRGWPIKTIAQEHRAQKPRPSWGLGGAEGYVGLSNEDSKTRGLDSPLVCKSATHI